MELNLVELRAAPQINWLVPYQWMTKMTNEALLQWETEAIEEALQQIKAEGRPISADPYDQAEKFLKEAKARVVDLARLVELDYTKLDINHS